MRMKLDKCSPAVAIGCRPWPTSSGLAAYPYHFHYADEELVIVLSGSPTLRPKGGGLRAFFRRDDRVGYFEGERPHEG